MARPPSPRAPVKITSILPADLDAVGQFLHDHLNRRIAPSVWADSLRHRWAADAPNCGMQLHDDEGRRVGVLCAVYSDQTLEGRVERFCNPHSWCVLDAYRHASIGLVLALLKQRGYHFSMFTPNPKVAQVFLGLRFRALDDGLAYFANLPRPWRRGVALDDPQRMEDVLGGAALQEYLAHRDIAWLRFVAFGVPGDMCLAIYKRGRWKKMPCALIGHFSDRRAASRHLPALAGHLLARGLLVSRVETRFLAQLPTLALRTRRLQPKLALSTSLADHQIRDVYSELMALDL